MLRVQEVLLYRKVLVHLDKIYDGISKCAPHRTSNCAACQGVTLSPPVVVYYIICAVGLNRPRERATNL